VSTPKEDCETLLNAVMPLVQQMLAQYREFFPCGATMSPTGEIALTMPPEGEEPGSEAQVALLQDGFRKQVVAGTCKATALALDVLMVPPGKSKKQDAVEVRLDHRDQYSVRVLFPYAISDAGELRVDEPITATGDGLVFH
jgi:hypothetical protein